MKILKYVISAGIGLLTAFACLATIGKDREGNNCSNNAPGPMGPGYPPYGYPPYGQPPMGMDPNQPQQPPQEGTDGQPMDQNQQPQAGMQMNPPMGPPSMGPMGPNGYPYQPNMGMMNPSGMIPNQGYPGYGNRQSNNLVSRLDKIQVTLVNFARFVSEIVRSVSLLVRSTDLAYSRIAYYNNGPGY